MNEMADVTSISQEGEDTLLLLMNEGARFRCRGVLTKHVAQELKRRCNRDSNELT